MIDIDRFITVVRTGSRPNKCFYHFTDVRNVASIKRHGLLSMAELKRRGLRVEHPGGNQWSLDADQHKGMNEYVHLCFWSQHPMEYRAREEGRIERSLFLNVSLDVLRLDDVVITDDVSNKVGVVGAPPSHKLGEIDLKVIYTKTDWTDTQVKARLLASRKYEILVPRQITLEYISGWS